MNDLIKGAFRDYPLSEQPERIPLSAYNDFAEFIKQQFGKYGIMFIPDAHKKSFGKDTTGDMDIVYVPHNIKTWVDDILCNKYIIVAHIKNGPQLMVVINWNYKRYMVDFLLTRPEDFEWKKIYIGFGTLIPAIVGSFARSLSYKFAMTGLFARIKNGNKNYTNFKLTSDPVKACRILGLDIDMLNSEELYTIDGVAKWVTESPRFDSDIWHKPPLADGLTIVVKNKHSHTAARKRDEVIEAYKKIDSVVKKSSWINPNYGLERYHFGDEFVDNMLKKVEEEAKKARVVLTGNEIMELLGIEGGPIIGKYKELLLTHLKFKDLSQEELNQAESKQQAKEILLEIHKCSHPT